MMEQQSKYLRPGAAAGLAAFMLVSGCQAVAVVTHSVSGDPVDAPAGAYRLDPDHTAVLFKVSHLGYSLYVGRFNQVSGEMLFDPIAPERSTVSVTLAAASVDTGNDVLDPMIREEAFQAEDHPDITFRSTGIVRTGPASGQITGDLTLAGQTAPVTLDVTFNGGADNPLVEGHTLGFAAKGRFDRTDFGVGNWIPAVGREVEIEIHTEFTGGA